MFKFLDWLIEALGWLQIMLSPFFIGLIFGGIIYLSIPGSTGILIGIFVILLGLIIGIVLANKIWKSKEGITWFLSRTMSTQDFDKNEPIEEETKID
jgi:hypothetical protein